MKKTYKSKDIGSKYRMLDRPNTPPIETKCPLIMFVRHGERADAKSGYLKAPCSDIPHDPCLTENGKQQAYITGEYIRSLVPDIDYKDIKIISSPLLRAMQTAAGIIQGLQLAESPIIQVKNAIIEEMYQAWTPKNPQTHCLIRTKPHQVVVDSYLMETQFEDEEQKKYKFPEACTESSDRFKEGFLRITNKYRTEKNSLVILVSHGRGVIEFCKYFGEKHTTWDYCSLSIVKKIKALWKVLMTDHSEHIPF